MNARSIFLIIVITIAATMIQFRIDAVAAVKSHDRIIVAYCKDCVPFHFTDETGHPAGIIIDLWHLWSEKTGILVEFKEADWDDSLTMVAKGKADAHAGLFYNKERDRFLDYGRELTKTDTHYFMHTALPLVNDMKGLSAYRVGVIKGDFVEKFLQQRLPEGTIVPFPDYDSIMNALQKGSLKIFAADTPTGIYHLKQAGLLSRFTFVSEKPLYTNDWHVAAREGSRELVDIINTGMARITDEERRGINRKWISAGETSVKTLVISMDRDYAPLTFVNPMGKPSGLFVDMWRAWAEKTGRHIEFRASSWVETLEGLRAGVVDIHSGLSYSKERARWIDFSTQIYETSSRIYHRTGEIQPEAIQGYENQIVGAISGTYQEASLSRVYPKIILRSYATTQQLIDALLEEEVKAIIEEKQSMSVALDRLGLRGDIAARPETLFPSAIHTGVIKGNTRLLEQINKGLSQVTDEALAKMETRWVVDPKDRFYKVDRKAFTLTAQEVTWLDNHPKITVGIMNAWPPMNFVDENGGYKGIGVDYIEALNKRLNGVLTIVPGTFKC